MERQQDYVLRTVEERGVRFVQLWFTRRPRHPQALRHHPRRARGRARGGHDLRRVVDRRVQPGPGIGHAGHARPQDVPAAAPVAGRGGDRPHVLDIHNLDGSPFEGDPRHVLRRTLEKARQRGFSFFVAPEMEFFYFGSSNPKRAPIQPLDQGSYFDLIAPDLTGDLRKRTILTLEEMGIPVEYSQHEDAPSQHEIDLRYTDALTMADTVVTFRLLVKEIAMRAGGPRHVHAQAARRSAGVGHAHPPFAVRGRHQRLLGPGGRLRPVRRRPRGSSPGCWPTPARSPPSPTSGSTPTSGWSRATRPRCT